MDDSESNEHGKDGKRAYEVGKGKPPKHSQFKPGVSGNPNGRSSKRPTTLDILKQELDREVPVTIGGQQEIMSQHEAMVKLLLAKASQGKVADIMAVLRFIADLEKGAPVDLSSLLDL